MSGYIGNFQVPKIAIHLSTFCLVENVQLLTTVGNVQPCRTIENKMEVSGGKNPQTSPSASFTSLERSLDFPVESQVSQVVEAKR